MSLATLKDSKSLNTRGTHLCQILRTSCELDAPPSRGFSFRRVVQRSGENMSYFFRFTPLLHPRLLPLLSIFSFTSNCHHALVVSLQV
jgi:hypothetical protein